jgi:hypothetical protein
METQDRSSPRRCYIDRAEMEDDYDLDEYFQNYVPISNLPTPPPVSATSSPIEDNLDLMESCITGKSSQKRLRDERQSLIHIT